MTALGLLHLLNETEQPVLYVLTSEGNTDVYTIRGKAKVIQIDWDWFTEGGATRENIGTKIREVERDWPDGFPENNWLSKRSILNDLRDLIADFTDEPDEEDDEDLDPDEDDVDPLF